jgi:molybdenum cofactor cytidylyltransferase
MKPEIALVILAAGESKRMGTPKQLLTWGKTTLIEHTINQAEQSFFKDKYVVLGANYDLISTQISNHDILVSQNKNWSKGLGNSISFAVQHIAKLNKYDAVLFVLADQPEINAKYLNSIYQKFAPNTHQIIANKYSNSFGVPVLFDRCYFDTLIQNQKSGAKDIITKNINQVTPAPLSINFIDIDTPEEYQETYLKYC